MSRTLSASGLAGTLTTLGTISTLTVAGAFPLVAGEGDAPKPPPSPIEKRLDELEQEIRVLKRKEEVAKEAAAASGPKVAVKAGDGGFSIASSDNAYTLKVGGYIQADYRHFADNENAAAAVRTGETDTFLLRRVRPLISGTIGEWVDFRLLLDFGNNAAALAQDAYIGLNLHPQLRLQVGKFKEPVGLERLQSGTNLLFIERGHPTNLVPNRDTGAQLSGEYAKFITYQLGVFNGTAENGNSDKDVNDDKDVAARLWLTPWKADKDFWLSGLGFGIAGSAGQDRNTLRTLVTPGQNAFLTYGTGVTAGGLHTRVSPQLYYGVGPVGVLAEYVSSKQEIKNAAGKPFDITNTAYQVALTWVITGEDASYSGVKPKHPFAPGKDGWGAWELALRIGATDVDDAVFTNGLSSLNTSASKASSVGVGVNWYLTSFLKWQLNYDHTTFDRGAAAGKDRDAEEFISTRLQVVF